jgi:hypothetical protein
MSRHESDFPSYCLDAPKTRNIRFRPVRLRRRPSHRIVLWAAFREEENQSEPYVCFGDSASRANVVGRAARQRWNFEPPDDASGPFGDS